tara:strand:- start:470 stop:1480 length:1011 start_codon:yes stop_codon:yes gene_type:complete
MSINLIQSIRTNILHIRSKETSIINDLNTNFTVILKDPIAVSKDEELHVSLTSLELPYSFYNVSTALLNNTLIYENNVGVKTTLNLLSQDYSINQIVDYLNADTDFKNVFTTSYNRQRMKITFINTNLVTRIIYFSDSNINKLIGFDENELDIVVPVDLTGIQSSGVINMCSVHSLFIRSNLSTGNVQSSRNGNSTILQKVSVDENSGGVVYFNANDQQQISVLNPQVISQIEINITDQNDNTIDLNNVNYEMSLLFEIFNKPDLNQRRNLIIPTINKNNNNRRTEELNKILIENQNIENQIDNHNNTHAIENTSEVEYKSDRIVLDALLDQISNK